MSWYVLKWIGKGNCKLDEKRVNGKANVRRQILMWVSEEFGDDGDQIHVTEEVQDTASSNRQRSVPQSSHRNERQRAGGSKDHY